MSAETITVVATFQAKPGKEAELKKALISLVAPTRKEAGCINYDLHVSPEDPAKFSLPRKLDEQDAPRRAFAKHAHSSFVAALGRIVRRVAGDQNLGENRLT
jgi:quinol monooxygenase YgiN